MPDNEMHAFVQLWCEHAGIVRSGPLCYKYGDPYQYALPFRIDNGTAIFEGLYAPIPRSVMCLAWHKVEELGLIVTWERRKNGTTRKVVKAMHKDIPVIDQRHIGHVLDPNSDTAKQGLAAEAKGLLRNTIVGVHQVDDKNRMVLIHQQDLSS